MEIEHENFAKLFFCVSTISVPNTIELKRIWFEDKNHKVKKTGNVSKQIANKVNKQLNENKQLNK